MAMFLALVCLATLSLSFAEDGVQDPCQWNPWTEWSSCDAPCGLGWKNRTRTSKNPGNGCLAKTGEITKCMTTKCEGCVYGNWNDWSSCSTTCGNGTSSRSKVLAASNSSCEGKLSENRSCSQQACPLNCSYGRWSEWSECSATCQGVRSRSRTFNIGSKDADACKSNSAVTESCAEQTCPTHCRWASWSRWGDCSAACGNGTSSRTRVIGQNSSDGGRNCTGDSLESRSCVGTNCVQTHDLVKQQTATLVTGVLKLRTDDPEYFTLQPTNKIVVSNLIATLSGYADDGLHVSLIPGVARMLQNRAVPPDQVDVWFSLMVRIEETSNAPTSRALVTRLCSKPVPEVTPLLTMLLAQGGGLVKGSVSVVSLNATDGKFFASAALTLPTTTATTTTTTVSTTEGIQARASGTTPTTTEKATTTALPVQEGIAVTHVYNGMSGEYVTRITGAASITVKDPILFAEDPMTSLALEKVLARLAGVNSSSVFASTMPSRGKPGQEVKVFFTIRVPGSNSTVTVPLADNITSQLIKSNCAVATSALQRLTTSDVVPASSINITAIVASVQRDAAEVVKSKAAVVPPVDPNKMLKVTGSMDLEVAFPRPFSADYRAEEGIKMALGSLTKVPEQRIKVAMAPKEQLPGSSSLPLVNVWFTLQLPLTSVVGSQDVAQQLKAEDLTKVSQTVTRFLAGQGITDAVKVQRLDVQDISNKA